MYKPIDLARYNLLIKKGVDVQIPESFHKELQPGEYHVLTEQSLPLIYMIILGAAAHIAQLKPGEEERAYHITSILKTNIANTLGFRNGDVLNAYLYHDNVVLLICGSSLLIAGDIDPELPVITPDHALIYAQTIDQIKHAFANSWTEEMDIVVDFFNQALPAFANFVDEYNAILEAHCIKTLH
jgi:hypothetical protein